MTPRTYADLSATERAQMARIYQTHIETHPSRIARHWGLSINGVRKIWRERPVDEMASLTEALAAFHAPVASRAGS